MKKRTKNIKPRVFLGIIVLIAFLEIAFLTFRSENDSWKCENGIWVKLGNPDRDMPNIPCGSKPEISLNATNTPKEAIINFYIWYLRQVQENPLVSEKYIENNNLTQEYKTKLKEALLKYKTGDVDPFVCGVEKSSFINPKKTTYPTNSTSIVNTEMTFVSGIKIVPIELTLVDNYWKIDNVDCENTKPLKQLGRHSRANTK